MSLCGKPFYLNRHSDPSGLSGTGIVAVGFVFPNGRIIFQWVTYRSSMEFYDTMDNLLEIHGHGGSTEVVFGNPPDPTLKLKKTKKKKVE
jgi:hypothetical protein